MALIGAFLLGGCGGSGFKMPKDEYRERVRVIGVLPLLVDESSTILHPERQEILELLRRQSAQKHPFLVERVKARKAYFDVRLIDGDPRQIYQQLVASSAIRGTGAGTYRRYHFNGRGAADLTQANVVDGLLVVVLNGAVRPERRWDRRSAAFLETEYNSILATAALVLPSGEIAWEYSGAPGEVFLSLEYPDFDEAFHNRTDEVRTKFISLPGLDRALAETEKSLLGKQEPLPRLYRDLLDRIAAAINPGMLNPLRRDGQGGAGR